MRSPRRSPCPQWPTAEQAQTLFDPASPTVRALDELDGLLLTGGGDIDPMLYRAVIDGSEEPHWPRDHVETGALRERVDDAADEERGQDRDERAQPDEEDAGRETDLVLTEVVGDGRASR